MKSNKRFLPLCILCLILLAGVAATAQQAVRPEVKHLEAPLISVSSRATAQQAVRPEVKLSLVGLVQRGTEAVPVEKAGQVNPGEIVSYTITAANAGTGPAREVRPFANIPPGTVFVAGSARAEGNAEIVYSIDGGKTFHATPMIEVRQPDGTFKKVPAPVTMYTQVRYNWNDPLAPGGRFTASYKVRVK